MTDPNFEVAIGEQINHLMRKIKQCTTMGYYVSVQSAPLAAPIVQQNKFSDALTAYLDAWAHQHKRRPYVRVHVVPSNYGLRDPHRIVIHDNDAVRVTLPNLKRYSPIYATLDLMSAKKAKGVVKGHGPLVAEAGSNTYRYSGRGKDGLKIITGVLNMPEHRAILLKG